jgi:alkaline phosphatase
MLGFFNRAFRPALVSALTLLPMLLAAPAAGQPSAPSVRILLPERTRLLQGQLVDLVVEVRNAPGGVSGFQATTQFANLTSRFGAAQPAQLDCDASIDWVLRANLESFENVSDIILRVSANVGGQALTDERAIQIFTWVSPPERNVILFIGDAMGTAFRDAARLTSRAVMKGGGSTFREGYFDDLLEMDKMPVSGMSMTYGSDSIVPDSANTGTAWATGNRSFLNAVNTFADGTDCRWRFNGQANAATLPFLLDNPRVENLWGYLKRRQGFRTGIVTTAAVTDATPAVQGAYSAFRQTRLEIARQYRENPMLGGAPAFDVMFGGGSDPFRPTGRTDGRDLIGEFMALGYRYVTTASQLGAISGPQPTIGLFKGSAAPAVNTNGITTAADVNMNVAYDKLGLRRPASEDLPSLDGFTDQPMLDLMTIKAIEILSSTNAPFILMVEGASIDKQAHPNHAAGTIWDTIEFDNAVGVARRWSRERPREDTLLVVTADHDQSIHIIGVNNVPDGPFFDRGTSVDLNYSNPAGAQAARVWGDSPSNARAGLPFINGSTGAVNNSGPGGMPMTFAPTNVTSEPWSSTYSTYFGNPLYRMGANGYPENSGPGIRRLAVGWRTGDHTGSSVPVTAEGPGALLFTGYMNQTDIMFKIAAALSSDTSLLDQAVRWLLRGESYPSTFGK